MKKMIWLVTLACAPAALHAQSVLRDTTLTISSNSSARIVADRVWMYVSIEGAGETPALAVTRLAQKVKSVSDSIAALGQRARAEHAIGMGILPAVNNNYPPTATPSFLARSVIRVFVGRLDDIAVLQAGVMGAGAITTSAQLWESSVSDSVFRTRVTQAVASARLTAETMAAAQGFRLGPMINMNTSSPNQFQQSGQITFDPRNQGYGSATPELTINASVSMQFRLLAK